MTKLRAEDGAVMRFVCICGARNCAHLSSTIHIENTGMHTAQIGVVWIFVYVPCVQCVQF